MIATFFHWRLREGMRDDFTAGWAAITEVLRAHGSLGSALFEQGDGTMRALARWPDRETRDQAFAYLDAPEAVEQMRSAIAETLSREDCTEVANLWVAAE